MDTLPTLPEWARQDESLDGWSCDTEPGAAPEQGAEAPSQERLAIADPLAIPLGELHRGARIVDPLASFEEVAKALAGADGDPVVVADAGKPLGVVRPPDVVRAMLASNDPETLVATAMMSSSFQCLRRDVGARRAFDLITQRGARETLVLDSAGRVVGVVMPEDLVRALAAVRIPISIA